MSKTEEIASARESARLWRRYANSFSGRARAMYTRSANDVERKVAALVDAEQDKRDLERFDWESR